MRERCPKCGCGSGNDWRQCEGVCPVSGSPHYKPPLSAEQQIIEDQLERIVAASIASQHDVDAAYQSGYDAGRGVRADECPLHDDQIRSLQERIKQMELDASRMRGRITELEQLREERFMEGYSARVREERDP